MLENPSDATTTVKRYAPPSQRNRVLNRRKSGDRLERINYSHGNDGDKNQVTSSRTTALDYGEAGINTPNENPRPGLIPIEGCCSSEAAQLLNEPAAILQTLPSCMSSCEGKTGFVNYVKWLGEVYNDDGWAAAIRLYNDPSIDLSERPVMYSGASGSAWGHAKLPPQIDFLAELRRVIRNSANAGTMQNAAAHN